MKYFIFFITCWISATSCKKENIPTKDSLTFNLNWKKKLVKDGEICGSSIPVLFNDRIVFHKEYVGSEKVLACLNKNYGDLVWTWDDPVDIYDGEKITDFAQKGDNLFVCSQNEVYRLDAITGKTIWKKDSNTDNLYGSPRISLENDRIFHERTTDDTGQNTFLVSHDIESGGFHTVFNMMPAQNQGYRSSFESYATYRKSDGDTLLLFQNRQISLSTLKDRIDLYALNLRTKEIEWKRDSIDADGNSSVQPILVDGDKAYFMGVVTLYCLNAKTGQTIWQKRFNQDYPFDQLNETLLFTTLVIVDGKLIVKPTDKHMYALDPKTGTEIWKLSDAASSPESMSVYKDLVMFPSSGKEGVFAYRVSDGKLMARLQSPHKSDGGQIVTGIAVDEKEGLLFCTDGYFGMCFKIDY